MDAPRNQTKSQDRVLVVDDDADMLDLLSDVLCNAGYEVCLATNSTDLRSYYETPQPEAVLLDMRLPDVSGLDLLLELKDRWPDTQVIMLTSFGSIDFAVEAVKRGAYHFQTKPFQTENLLALVRKACERTKQSRQTDRAEKPASHSSGFAEPAAPVFRSPAIKAILRIAERIAPSEASVLLTGESGTGKEVFADFIHAHSHRAHGPLVKVNCAALPHELIESELFGVVKGAYTGAHADREGLFRQAEGGTILLDEISEMPLDTQSKLLRVLQDKVYRPVGGKTNCRADCRLIASTNRRPEEAIRDSKLRADLYYRISAVALHLPPLRERPEDIMPLAGSFLKRLATQTGRCVTGFSEEASEALQRYPWPGNVRELHNEIQRVLLVSEGTLIEIHDLSIPVADETAMEATHGGLPPLEALERDAIVKALGKASGNKTLAARELGVTRQTLYNKLKYFGLDS